MSNHVSYQAFDTQQTYSAGSYDNPKYHLQRRARHPGFEAGLQLYGPWRSDIHSSQQWSIDMQQGPSTAEK